MEPLVSIIMSVHNDQDTLKTAIKSIEKQTYSNWEFIIYDDASTDNSKKILESFSSKNKKITLISGNLNKGLAYGLNKCILKSSGNFIARMDADDISYPTRIEDEMDYLTAHDDISVIGCNLLVFNGKENIGVRKMPERPAKEDFVNGSPFAHPTVIIRKNILSKINGYSSKVGRAEDLDLWFRIYEFGCKGYNLQKVLYRYKELPDDYKKRTIKDGFKTMLVFIKGFKRLNIPIYYYTFALKPLISSIVPNKVMIKYHSKKLR